MAGSLPDIDALAVDDLKVLILRVIEENAGLKAENAALREEIARLKGLKGPPKLKPSGMEKGSEPGLVGAGRKTGCRGSKIKRLVIDEERAGHSMADRKPREASPLGVEPPTDQLPLSGSIETFECEDRRLQLIASSARPIPDRFNFVQHP